MRVYEYAKEHGISNKDIILFLQQHGFEIQSHMAVIPPPAMPLLAQKFESLPATTSVEPVSAPISEKIEPVKPIEVKIEEVPPLAQSIVLKSMTVADFAQATKKQVGEVILTLLREGIIANKNQIIDEKAVALLARHYGLTIDERVKKESLQGYQVGEARSAASSIVGKQTQERLPVVVVVGHVDHGKTTLLDFIRKTRVASREKGGITQHLGAYEVHTKQGELIFLDTPGHAAFSKMRERGTRVADIAVLVVAADDGIMPQTIEAIKQSQASRIPLVVAINKIDKASASQIESIKHGLTQYGLVPEEWGGQTVTIPISAKMGTGIDELLDVLVLQSKLMELTAALDVPARGYILEAKQEKGRGAVATVICQHGTLRVGDTFRAGVDIFGKVSSLIDSGGKRIKQAYPSQPVQVAGFDKLPQAGDAFEVVSTEDIKKLKHDVKAQPASFDRPATGDQGINVVIKTDSDSTREALVGALDKINEKAFRKIHIVQATIGNVSEGDVQLALDTNSAIYMLHTKADPVASALISKYNVPLYPFDIIYKLLENLEQLSAAGRPVKKVSKKVGEAIVLKVFEIKSLGRVAGSQVRTGKLVKDGKVTVWRGKYKVGEGVIKSLQREKRAIKEALTGVECAFMVDGFDEWVVDDRVECSIEVPQT